MVRRSHRLISRVTAEEEAAAFRFCKERGFDSMSDYIRFILECTGNMTSGEWWLVQKCSNESLRKLGLK